MTGKSIFTNVISVISASILVVSGLYAVGKIDFLEIRLYETGIFNWYLAAILTRIFTGFYFIIALLLVINIFINTRKFILTFSTILSIPLLLEVFAAFSATMIEEERWGQSQYTPWWITGTLLLIIIILLFSVKSVVKPVKFPTLKVIVVVVCFLLVSFPFLVNPVFAEDFQSAELTSIPLENLDELGWEISEKPVLFCYYTTACPFCKRAAKKIFLTLSPELRNNVHVFFMSDEQEAVNYFWDVSNVKFNYTIPPLEIFYKWGGNSWPRFRLVKGTRQLGEWDGRTFNYAELNRLDDLLK